MSECTHDCSSCGENCAEREMKPEDFLVKLSQGSSVKKVIGVVSGKGGVGKSMVTSLLAAASMREGFKTAILDGDITGPSIPKAFGLSINLVGNADGLILPATTTCDACERNRSCYLERSGTWRCDQAVLGRNIMA